VTCRYEGYFGRERWQTRSVFEAEIGIGARSAASREDGANSERH